MNVEKLRVRPGHAVDLADYDPADTLGLGTEEVALDTLGRDLERLGELQTRFYAARSHAMLIVLQALDAAGKDGVVKHVFTGMNPQGVRVTGFRAPTAEERAHDFLWRHAKALPERGEISIFNRSHYEEVLTVRVHPELLAGQNLPDLPHGKRVWRQRFKSINSFERHLARNGVHVIKFFLHLSRGEQRKRLEARIDTPDKNWKFEPADLAERARWDDYQDAYQSVLRHTSTDWAPWYVVPADHKWATRAAVAQVLVEHLESLGLKYPPIDDAQRSVLEQARTALEGES